MPWAELALFPASASVTAWARRVMIGVQTTPGGRIHLSSGITIWCCSAQQNTLGSCCGATQAERVTGRPNKTIMPRLNAFPLVFIMTPILL